MTEVERQELPEDVKRLAFGELLPAEWRQSDGSALMAAYRMVGVSFDDLRPPITAELGDVALILGWTSLPVLQIRSAFEPRRDGQVQISIGTPDGETHPTAPTACLLTRTEWTVAGLAAAEDRLHAMAGFLAAIEGLPFVMEHLENYQVLLPGGGLKPTAVPLVRGPWLTQGISVTDDARSRWALGAAALEQHPDRERIELSLRWLEEGKRAEGLDAFLKLWFAIETLAMPDTSNFRPVRDRLARIYDVSAEEAGGTFRVNRIYDLRNRVVHDGARVPMPGAFLLYMDALYVDLLSDVLGFASAKKAGLTLQEAGGAENVLPALVGGRAEEVEAEQSRIREQEFQRMREQDEDAG